MSGDAPERDIADLTDEDLREGLWDREDVAKFLKVSARSVYDLPGMPRVKLRITGARALVRFIPAEVRAWARARLTHSLRKAS